MFYRLITCVLAFFLGQSAHADAKTDAMGQLWVKGAVGNEMLEPVEVSMQHCRENSFGCKFLGSHDSGLNYLDENPNTDQSENNFPMGRLHWNLWAMVAQVRGADGRPDAARIWLISGQKGYAAACKQVPDRCDAESGTACTIVAHANYDTEVLTNDTGIADGLLVNFKDAAGRSRWTSAVGERAAKKKSTKKAAVDPVTAQDRVQAVCGSAAPCKVIATYDAATPRLQVIEHTASPRWRMGAQTLFGNTSAY